MRQMRGARQHPILHESKESKELPLDLLEIGIRGANYYHQEHDNPPYHHRAPGSIPHLFVREGIGERLLRVERKLQGDGYALYVHDAYRPVAVQAYFYHHFVPNQIRLAHPDWSEEEIMNETRKYWSPSPDTLDEIDIHSPPPHATGGVVDVTLFDLKSGHVVDMGSPFDEVSERSHPEYLELHSEIDLPEARLLRRRLYFSMRKEGFVPHPNEWWHYGFGDQVSAFHSGQPHAVYGLMRVI
jgi:zinc D-Ala-D-Ala dipeptidase